MVKQVSVFLENRSGRLHQLTRVLGENNVNIRALCVAETAEFGVIRLVVNKPDKAVEALEKEGFAVQETDVLAVEVEDIPGGLSRTLEPLSEKGINIDYLYCFMEKMGGKAVLVIRIPPGKLGEAVEAMKAGGSRMIPEDELYSM